MFDQNATSLVAEVASFASIEQNFCHGDQSPEWSTTDVPWGGLSQSMSGVRSLDTVIREPCAEHAAATVDLNRSWGNRQTG